MTCRNYVVRRCFVKVHQFQALGRGTLRWRWLGRRLLASLAFLVAMLGVCRGDEPVETFQVTKEVEISRLFGIQYHMVADLGVLPLKSVGDVKIRIKNPENQAFPIKELTTSRRCTDARLSSMVIEPHGSIDIKMRLETPGRSSSPNVSNGIHLKSKDGPARDIRLVVRYSLAGLLNFLENFVIVEIDESTAKQEAQIPIVLTDPVKLSGIECTAEGADESIAVDVVETDGKPFVRITFYPAKLTNSVYTVPLLLSTHDGLINDRLTVSLCKVSAIEISPRIVRLFKKGDHYEGMCMIRDRLAASNRAEHDLPNVEVRYGDKPAGVKVERLAAGIYRARLKIAATNIPDEKPPVTSSQLDELTWSLMTSENKYTERSQVLIRHSPSTAPLLPTLETGK